ncbi:MAG: hypothetical protein ACRD21_21740 [Vicinamibacteria bacterium]
MPLRSRQRTTKSEAQSEKETLSSSWFGRPSGIQIDRDRGLFRGGIEPYRVGIAFGY